MTTAKQLAKYFANNTVDETEVERRLNTYHDQCVKEGIESMHRFWLSLKKRRNSLRRQRLKGEWDAMLEKFRDINYPTTKDDRVLNLTTNAKSKT